MLCTSSFIICTCTTHWSSALWMLRNVFLFSMCLSLCVWFRPQPGGDAAEAQRGTDVAGAGDGWQERGVRDEWRASRPHPRETDLPHVWRLGKLAFYKNTVKDSPIICANVKTNITLPMKIYKTLLRSRVLSKVMHYEVQGQCSWWLHYSSKAFLLFLLYNMRIFEQSRYFVSIIVLKKKQELP